MKTNWKLTALMTLAALAVVAAPISAWADRDNDSRDEGHTSSSVKSSKHESKLRARITGNGIASISGKAEYEVERGVKKLEVELKGVPAAAGTTLSVSIDGNNVGTGRVSRGKFKFKIRGAGVPAIAAGSTVIVYATNGTNIAGGTF